MAGWTLPTGHPNADLVNSGYAQLRMESPAPVVPVSSQELDALAKANELKGEALDEALDAADLPKTGTADEKRARLAEHLGAVGGNLG